MRACVYAMVCINHYVFRLYIWESQRAIRSQESTRHQTCHCFFPSPGTDTPVGLSFKDTPSPFSDIKVAFERAIRSEGEPFMWFVEHGRGPLGGRLKKMDAPGRCMKPARAQAGATTHMLISLLTLQRDCNITGKITQQMSLFVYLHTLNSLCAKCK